MIPASEFTLKHFILKQKVLNLYRYVIRASRVIPDPVTRRETVAWIRSEFERNKHLTDVLTAPVLTPINWDQVTGLKAGTSSMDLLILQPMEVFMTNIDYNVTQKRLAAELAEILHSRHFSGYSTVPINFHVVLFKDKKGHRQHSGSGILTLPSQEIGRKFLHDYSTSGNLSPVHTVKVGNRLVKFGRSHRGEARPEVLEAITRRPYIDPAVVKESERITHFFATNTVVIRTLQFGWQCRDSVFSIEWEHVVTTTDCRLSFDNERRELRINIRRPGETTLAIAIRFSNLITKSTHVSHSGEHTIFFTMETPPVFESEPSNPPRLRLSALPLSHHDRVSPYISLALRIVCGSQHDLNTFHSLCKEAKLQYVHDLDCLVERRGLFSVHISTQLEAWMQSLNWCVAFQVESILRNVSADMTEMLALMPHITKLRNAKGKRFVAAMLAQFGQHALELYWHDSYNEPETLLGCFFRVLKEFEAQSMSGSAHASQMSASSDPNLFDAYHVEITPTTMRLSGPHPERSNRIIRRYHPDHHESFLRVSFVDEARLQYRFERDLDGRGFIQNRLGPIFSNGLYIAGRKFEFLAYSQSALKEHAVWFVKPFRDPNHGYVDARKIISSIGSFENLPFDPNLMLCPARYGARISQAFTATDVSITIHPEEVLHIPDIKTASGKYCFTDGVGTISRELAIEVSKEIKSYSRRFRRMTAYAPALQVRFQGSKGMLSVDHALGGRAICLRPSMVKFEATSLDIEIARAFDKPGPYFLNRPLIMLLENLGVKYEVFKQLQDRAVLEANQSTQSLDKAARLLEMYGLGSSFRLTSAMLGLAKLVDHNRLEDKFYQQLMECAIHHVLRLLKNRARIPVPNAWTLVGVADIHKFLQQDEIFACLKPVEGPVIYLEGPVLVSRSPTIHPGDVQIVRAIGHPPKGSCFAQEPLFNTVVFSVLGPRPLPSCLGGGDLDGDVYNLIPLNNHPDFNTLKTHEPAEYSPAQRKLLNRPSTMQDVAEFVMEYILSDAVGIIATNWLIIADQSEKGIFDERCMMLSKLHSDAVDYPKSGQPVAIHNIPKVLSRPDWNAPETVNADSAMYYQSQRAIGRLFRDITLPTHVNLSRRPRRRGPKTSDELVLTMNNLSLTDEDDEIVQAVRMQIGRFIDTSPPTSTDTPEDIKEMFQAYVSRLTFVCTTYSLSFRRPLTEQEVVIGTIVQKTSQPRLRQDMTAKLREHTDILVRGIREDLAGDKTDDDLYLTRAWLAWELSIRERISFGGESFGWIALGAVFDAIKEIENKQLEVMRNMYY
ncbi:hypothetical protein H0H93_008133 [Arthromyces matolae]|nr:hypothetical protein H0H93_008133 [Arthromyces matolae]